MNPLHPETFSQQVDIEMFCELDEQWSYVGKKSELRWLWYTWSLYFKQVVAYTLGYHTDEVLQQFLKLLQRFHFRLYFTDEWRLISVTCSLSSI